ncbi:MAG TPA: transcriptional regulator, TraR/DksA family protein [Armatimonadetes bacterium]|nr:transcriptional regulator, TraR/DksA family protein [Armatimonadota bacterium]
MKEPTIMRPDLNQEFYEALLRAERARLEQMEQELEEKSRHANDSLEAYSEADDVPADSAALAAERERDQMLVANIQQTLGQIDFALDRISDGDYGICEICGVEVPEDRLERIPWASTCVDCQSDLEEG